MSWQLTLLSLVLLPAFILPARWIGQEDRAASHARATSLNAETAQIMNERFNVAGAHLVKIFGDPQRESRSVRRTGRPGPRHRRHARHVLDLVPRAA